MPGRRQYVGEEATREKHRRLLDGALKKAKGAGQALGSLEQLLRKLDPGGKNKGRKDIAGSKAVAAKRRRWADEELVRHKALHNERDEPRKKGDPAKTEGRSECDPLNSCSSEDALVLAHAQWCRALNEDAFVSSAAPNTAHWANERRRLGAVAAGMREAGFTDAEIAILRLVMKEVRDAARKADPVLARHPELALLRQARGEPAALPDPDDDQVFSEIEVVKKCRIEAESAGRRRWRSGRLPTDAGAPDEEEEHIAATEGRRKPSA